jgi:hypothetical protein
MYVVCIYIPEEELASVKAMSLELTHVSPSSG